MVRRRVAISAPLLQNVEYQDSRILTIDTPQADRVQTSEKKNLLIDSFVRWRISEPRAFRVSFPGGERSAEERISTLVRDALNQAVNKRTVNEITSRQREKAMEEIRIAVQESVKGLGVECRRPAEARIVPEISDSFTDHAGRAQAWRTTKSSYRQRRKIAPMPPPARVLLAEAYSSAHRSMAGRRESIATTPGIRITPIRRFLSHTRGIRTTCKNRNDRCERTSSEFFKYLRGASRYAVRVRRRAR